LGCGRKAPPTMPEKPSSLVFTLETGNSICKKAYLLKNHYSATKPFDRLTAMSLSAMSSRPNGEVEWAQRPKEKMDIN